MKIHRKTSSIVHLPINATSLSSFPIPFSFLKGERGARGESSTKPLSTWPSDPSICRSTHGASPWHLVGRQCGCCLHEPQSSRRDHQPHRHEPRPNWSVNLCWGNTERGREEAIRGDFTKAAELFLKGFPWGWEDYLLLLTFCCRNSKFTLLQFLKIIQRKLRKK